jgi:hypothetical protein
MPTRPPGSGSPLGIPYVGVPSTQLGVSIASDYGDESDPGPCSIAMGAGPLARARLPAQPPRRHTAARPDTATSPRRSGRGHSGWRELWDVQIYSRPLADLGWGKSDYLFDVENQRLIVWYSGGRAYLFDLEWLPVVVGDPTFEEIVQFACQALGSYTENEPPKLCE